MRELVHAKTRLALRELMTGLTLRQIDDEFSAVGLKPNNEHSPQMQGQRRSRVEQYFAAMNFRSPEHAQALIRLCDNVLVGTGECDARTDLLAWLQRDGYELRQGRLVSTRASTGQTQIDDAAEKLGAEHLGNLISRMREALEQNDPDLVIGSAKELIESCCKTIMSERNIPALNNAKIPELLRSVRDELKLVPESVPNEKKGADSIRRILGSLAAIGQGVAELRSLYGTGHGREGKSKGLSMRHARLVAGAAETLCNFLFETHQEFSN